MAEPVDWLERMHQEHPEASIMAGWLLELLDRGPDFMTHRQWCGAQTIMQTLFDLVDQYRPRR